MPERLLVAKEFSELLSVLGHPLRIRIIEDLRYGEKDVGSISDSLEIAHSEASRHLSILKSHRIVAERREGRFHFYHLQNPELAEWLATGLIFIDRESSEAERIHHAVETVQKLWLKKAEKKAKSSKKGK